MDLFHSEKQNKQCLISIIYIAILQQGGQEQSCLFVCDFFPSCVVYFNY